MTFFTILWKFARDRRGGVSVLMAFALPAFVGTLALGTEISLWLLKNRSLQNAADSAVIAASLDGGASYMSQAKAVTARYGLVDGAAGVTVTGSNVATCATGETNCYSVKIAAAVPVYLGAIVGYLGNAGSKSTTLSAIAYAKPSGAARQYCLVALASSGVSPAIVSKGSPKSDLTGCGVASKTAMSCAGHDLRASFGDAGGVNDGCGIVRRSNVVKPLADPYAPLAAKLPADSCGGVYPLIGALPVSNKWSGTKTLGSITTICGDLQLTGNVTINAPSDAILIIRNGQLDLARYRFSTAAGSGLAVVFTGNNDAAYKHQPAGSGALDIVAPTTGIWSGVALYQDPALTKNIQMPNAASAPTWAFSGLIYLPHADLDFSGSVGKGSNGALCTVLIANSIALKGTGLVLSTLQCGAAGLQAPTDGASSRGTLVG